MEQYPLLELEASCILRSSLSSLALLKIFAAGRSELPQREMFLGRKHSVCLMCLLVQISIRLGCRQPVLSLDTFKIINLSGMWWLFVISVEEIIKLRLETWRNTSQILVCCRKPAHRAQDVGACLVLNYKSSVRT